MNKEVFLTKLSGLVALAKENGSQITIDEVKEYFSEIDLTEEQTELVFDYLLAQKVVVKGYIKVEEAKEDAASLTEEEEAYLAEYMTDLEAFQKANGKEKEELFKRLASGEKEVKGRLTELYLLEVVEIAKEMHTPEIFLGDLIQEGNVGLLIGMEQVCDPTCAHETIITQVRQAIQMLIEEHTELSSRDKKMVEKVSALDEGIKALTEELGRKVSIDELAVYMGMTEDEIEDILKLMGEETEEEEA